VINHLLLITNQDATPIFSTTGKSLPLALDAGTDATDSTSTGAAGTESAAEAAAQAVLSP